METSRYRKDGQRWALICGSIFLAIIAIIVTANLVFWPVGYYPWYPFGFGWIWIPFTLFFLFFALRWFFWPWRWGYQRGHLTGDDAYYILRERLARGEITREQFEQMSANLRARVLLLAVLELIVGGIVVLGGAALVNLSTDATGISLGVVHAILGLMAFPAGYLLLTGKAGARTLTLGVDAAIIAFSAASEIILSTIGSLARGPLVDSIAGTTVAVLIAAVIVYQLMSSSFRLLQTAHTRSAGPGLSRTSKIEGRSV